MIPNDELNVGDAIISPSIGELENLGKFQYSALYDSPEPCDEWTLADLEGKPYANRVFAQVATENHEGMTGYVGQHFPAICQEAEDIVQVVFTELCETLRTGLNDREIPVRTWLYDRLYRKCLDFAHWQKAYPF